MGVAKPKDKIKVFFAMAFRFFNFSLLDASQRKIIAGMSKAAGTLNRVEIEKSIPEKKRFFGVNLLLRSIRKASIVGPIMNSSALTILPSKRGIVVSSAKMQV